jgi:hypothetical protein
MSLVSRIGVFTASLTLVASVAFAQKTTPVHPGKGGSPHVRTEWTVSGANISVEYGRPSVKGRTIGKDVDPLPGQIWRLGADEATILKTDKALQLGNVAVPAGTYSLWVITDNAGGWKLVVNKTVPKWGTMYPGAEADLARIDMKVEKLAAPVEQLTIDVDEKSLSVSWGGTKASVPLAVK